MVPGFPTPRRLVKSIMTDEPSVEADPVGDIIMVEKLAAISSSTNNSLRRGV